MAFISGYFGGQVDRNASPVELGSWFAGNRYQDQHDR